VVVKNGITHFALSYFMAIFIRHRSAPQGINSIMIEAKLRYRQADQGVAEALLGAVSESINLKEIYGLTKVPPLPVVDMVTKQASFNPTK
jgi:hypothetical protein